MASSYFLNPSDILSKNNMLDYINYENISEENRELLLSNLWDFEFITAPAAVFFPGNEVIKRRLTSVQLSPGGSIGNVQATIRGYTIQQAAGVSSNGTVSLSFIDKEDQAISMFIRDWQEKITCMDNKFQYRKEDTVATCRLVHLNTSRIPIAQWTLITCQPSNGTISRPFSSEENPSNAGDINLDLNFEHMHLDWKNIPA